MTHNPPVPRDKIRRLILLIAITFAVLSVVTFGPLHARFQRPPDPVPTHVTQRH